MTAPEIGKRPMECGFWVSTSRRCRNPATAILGGGSGSIPICNGHSAWVFGGAPPELLNVLGFRQL